MAVTPQLQQPGAPLPEPSVAAAAADAWQLHAASEFAAAPADGFSRLWVPHRMVYVADSTQPEAHNCPFCAAPQGADEDGLIVARGTHAYVLLNLYPYNGGHLLVCPYRHIPLYSDATVEETAEIAALTQTAMRVLTAVSGCHGFNIGMNQGEVAGAGVAAHLHQHVVPRWGSDANFLPIIGRTRALPELLADTRRKLAAAWPAAAVSDPQ